MTALCIEGFTWNDNTCTCEADPKQGDVCGNTTCGNGQVCCNASCGICTDPGGFCTEQFCL